MNTFNYNSSQVNYYTTIDFGNIGESPTSIVDNGETSYDLVVTSDYIVDGDYIINDYNQESYGEINFTETTYPFGTVKITSTTNSSATVVFISKPEPIKLYEKAIVIRKQAWTGSGTLFEIANGTERIVAPYIGGSGPLRVLGSAVSSRVHTFTEDSITTYGSSIDHGSVGSTIGSSIDYGQITNIVDGGEINYGDIISSDGSPYGLFKLSGYNSTDLRIRAWQGSGSSNISGQASIQFSEPIPQIYIVNGFGQINVYNSIIPDSFTRSTYYGSGSLFNIGNQVERTTYSYNTESPTQESLAPEDYGYVSASSTTFVDYGSVTSISTSGEIDYGPLSTETIKFGSFKLNGSASIILTNYYTGNLHIEDSLIYNIPTTIKLSGSVNVQFIEPPNQFYVIDNRTLFIVSGGYTNLSFTKGNYTGSGSLFKIGEKREKAVFTYNSSSIVYTEQSIDNGSVSSPIETIIDYGQTNQNASGELDYGNIIGGDGIPYGLFSITGSANQVSSARIFANPELNGYKLSGSYSNLKFSSQAGENTVLFSTSGGDRNSITKPFIASGSLFHIGDRVERTTYNYNTSSISSIGQPVSYGDLTNATAFVDYGFVSLPYYENYDYGNIITDPGEENPFGLFKISGSSDYEFFPTFAWQGRGGFTFTHQPQPTDTRFMPWWRGYGEFSVYNSIIPDAIVKVFTGKGSLFNIGDKQERVTYNYNQSSVVEFTTGIDYGSVGISPSQTLDFGIVSEFADSGEFDFGSIVVTDITYPLTGLFNFSGAAGSQFIRGPYSGSGRITYYKGKSDPTDFRFMPWWRGYGEISFTSTTETPRSRTHVGFGSLFHIGDKVERATYSYNTSSIEFFGQIQDFGNVSAAPTNYDDYGSVTSFANGGEVDLGSITNIDSIEPYGLFKIKGQSDNRWIQVFTKIGSGSLFTFNSLTESITSNPPENTALFNFAGGYSTLSFGKGNYTGSGSLFHIGDKVERATFHYNTSSIRGSFSSSDNGYIDSTPTSSTDLGNVFSSYYENFDYGHINDEIGTENPFGLFKISGSAIQPKKIANWVGSGTLFTTKGAAEAASWQTPENTFLFNFSGGATEKHVENWIGSGNIKFKEETPLAPNAAVRFRPWWRGVGGLNISGFGDVEDVLINYVARGGLFKIYTAAEGFEWRSYRPSPRYVNSVYGNIGGTFTYNGNSTTQKINVYGYYGDLKDPGTSGSLFGIGGSAETVSVSEVSTGLFRFSGTAPSKWNPSWTSRPDGSPRLSGTPNLQLRFNLFGNVDPTDNFKVSGTPDLKIRKIYTGSGTLFNFESAIEIVGFNPDLETGLFAINGAGKTNFSLLNIGSGSLFAVGSGAESSVVNPEENTVLYRFSGSGIEKQSVTEIGSGSASIDVSHEVLVTRGYAGDGSLFGIGGNVYSVTQSESESVALFTIGGGASDSFTRISSATKAEITIDVVGVESATKEYIGSGSLFSIGSLEEKVTFSTTSTVLFKIAGLATDIQASKNFIGSGSLFAVGSGAESSVVNPEENTVLYRFTGRSVEKQTDRYISDGVFEFISGTSEESSTRSFVGRGSLFSVVSATESRTTSQENTVLYSVSGRAVVKSVNKHFGSGSEFISGAVDDSTTKVFTGSGSLFAVGNSAESRTISLESTQLFRTSGSATESFSRSTYEASGQANISGQVSDLKRTFGNQVFAYQTISGNLVERQTDSYIGSGSLFGFKNASSTRSVNIETKVTTNLFKVFGSNPGSVTRITTTETAVFTLSNTAGTKLRLFSPIRIFGTII